MIIREQYEGFDGEMILEASMSRIYHHTKNSSIALVSAFRGENTAEANEQRHQELRSHLHDLHAKHGFGHIPVEGGWVENAGTPHEKEVREKSFLIIAHPSKGKELEKSVSEIAKRYNQEAYIVVHPGENAKAVGTKKGNDVWPSYGAREDIGKWHPRQIGQYFTQFRNRHHKKQRFSFGSVQEETDTRKSFGFFIAPQTFFNRTEHIF